MPEGNGVRRAHMRTTKTGREVHVSEARIKKGHQHGPGQMGRPQIYRKPKPHLVVAGGFGLAGLIGLLVRSSITFAVIMLILAILVGSSNALRTAHKKRRTRKRSGTLAKLQKAALRHHKRKGAERQTRERETLRSHQWEVQQRARFKREQERAEAKRKREAEVATKKDEAAEKRAKKEPAGESPGRPRSAAKPDRPA